MKVTHQVKVKVTGYYHTVYKGGLSRQVARHMVMDADWQTWGSRLMVVDHGWNYKGGGLCGRAKKSTSVYHLHGWSAFD